MKSPAMAPFGRSRASSGYDEAADLLQETLNQEGDTDKKLTRLAEGSLFTSGINEEAARK